jgi:hypothetical protein
MMESMLPANSCFLIRESSSTALIYGVLCIEVGILPARQSDEPVRVAWRRLDATKTPGDKEFVGCEAKRITPFADN